MYGYNFTPESMKDVKTRLAAFKVLYSDMVRVEATGAILTIEKNGTEEVAFFHHHRARVTKISRKFFWIKLDTGEVCKAKITEEFPVTFHFSEIGQ